MYVLTQLFFRILGMLLIVLAIVLATEGGDLAFQEYGVQLNNSAFRTSMNIIDGDTVNIGAENNNQPLWGILDVKSFFFVVGLLFGFLFIAFDIGQIKDGIYESIFRSPPRMAKQMDELVKRLKSMSESYYVGGADALRKSVNVSKMPASWAAIIEQVELKIPFSDIMMVMGNQASLVRKRYDNLIKMMTLLSNVAPSLGVIGTVLGLVKLLYNLSDPSTLGPSMALALLTTLYGLFFSIIIFKPLITRLENIKVAQMNSFQYAAFWLNIISLRKPAFYLEQNFSKKLRQKK